MLIPVGVGAPLRVELETMAPLRSVAWSADGRWLFTALDDHHVAAIDPETGAAWRVDAEIPAGPWYGFAAS